MIIPLANLVCIIMLAFSKWPIQEELEKYRMQLGYSGGGFPVMQGMQPPPAMMPPPLEPPPQQVR